MSEQLFLHHDGHTHGPYELTTVRTWHRVGSLPDGTLASTPDGTGWMAVADRVRPPSAPTLSPPPGATPPGGARHTDTVAFAGLGPRLAAVVVDVALFYLVALVASVPAQFVGDRPGPLSVLAVLTSLGAFVVVGIVWPIAGIARLGQTYGKHLLGIQVVPVGRPGPLGGGLALARQLLQSLGLQLLGIGWLWAVWDEHNQGLHDKAVGTVVVPASTDRRMGPVSHLSAALRRTR